MGGLLSFSLIIQFNDIKNPPPKMPSASDSCQQMVKYLKEFSIWLCFDFFCCWGLTLMMIVVVVDFVEEK